MKITDRILESFSLIWTSKVWPHTPNEIVKILLYVHEKGWLYLIIKDDRVVGLSIAYTVEKFEDIDRKYPLKDGGRILFTPIAIIKDGYKMYCFRRFNDYIKSRKRDFDELVFEKDDHLIRKNIGVKNEKEQRGRITSTSDVSS